MATDTKRLTGAKCKAKNRRGERCGGLAGSDGLCSAHRDPDRMKELGSRGGRARRKGAAEKLPKAERESLRQHLRDTLDHATVVEAVERSLAGGNESARVAAVKFLADLELYKQGGEEEDRARERAIATAEAAERFDRLVMQRAAAHERGQVRDALEELAAELGRMAVEEHPDVTRVVVGESRARAVLQGLEEVGLIVPGHKVDELVEARA